MFNQVIKWTIIVSLWRKYKHHVFATLALLLSLVLVNYIHSDFVEYAKASANDNIGYSYLFKWLVFIGLIGLYIWQIKRVNKAAKFDSKLHKMMNSAPTKPVKTQKTSNSDSTHSTDPFANIRSKKKLRSEADFLIEKDK